ncbi:MAG: hybrid sensor histidine kinase/response regulator [Verrucomicrobiota bacterium]|nr:hybrid sensor histidine kinase/response regulator [Verrucomicrobiota bacterium]
MTILIVDDMVANLHLLSEILRSKGHRVMAFPSAKTALLGLQKIKPDLMLLDIRLPDMDGFELGHSIKADPSMKETPLIFISALDDTKTKVQAFKQGGVDYITKPFQEDEVLARVENQLNQQRQKEQIEVQRTRIDESYRELLKLEKMRDNLVHMFAHDMRTPLTIMLVNLQVIEMQLKQGMLSECVEPIQASILTSLNLRDMISNMLDVSKLESEQVPLESSNWDIGAIISDVVSSVQPIAGDKELKWVASEKTVNVFCDKKITYRIIENLISNSIRYSKAKSPVEITCECNVESVKVSIRDHGLGIPAKSLETIFEKFEQLEMRGSSLRFSSGIGLYFCKLAVEAQDGRIGVVSDEGQGSLFWFTLPSCIG